MVITPEGIQYLHRRGEWHIRWENIIRFDVPRVNRVLELEDAPFLGFRLHNVEEVLDEISPRLASTLLFEAPATDYGAKHQAPDREDYTPYFDIPTATYHLMAKCIKVDWRFWSSEWSKCGSCWVTIFT